MQNKNIPSKFIFLFLMYKSHNSILKQMHMLFYDNYDTR